MTEQEMKARIERSRELIDWSREEYQSDQTLKKPQPPLVKAPMTENTMELPKNFGDLPMDKSFLRILHDRRSNRVFTGGSMDLLTLSFLLWAQQGIRGIRGNNYATLRTVPSAGSRHPFECYPLILNVEGLEPGLYHYLPMEHRLEFLKSADIKDEAFADRVVQSVSRQKWVLKSSVIFYYSIVPYRGEWRYAFNAPRVMMIDAGHVTENLYLACSALDLGTCAIAAMDSPAASEMFGLDGKEEYIFYCAPVGTVSEENEAAEQIKNALAICEAQYGEAGGSDASVFWSEAFLAPPNHRDSVLYPYVGTMTEDCTGYSLKIKRNGEGRYFIAGFTYSTEEYEITWKKNDGITVKKRGKS